MTASGEPVDEDRDPSTERGGRRTPAEKASIGLQAVRDTARYRWVVTAVGAVVGVALVTAHWLGLVVGGALVGIAQRDLKRAVAAAFAFGVVVLTALVFGSPRLQMGELLALSPVVYVTVGSGIGLPVLGSLLRGVF